MRGIDLKKIAEKMNGASGAELKVFFHSVVLLISLFSFLITSSLRLTSCYILIYPLNV